MARSENRRPRGELEALVMDTLWADDAEWLTPRDVHDVIARNHPLAYTTVMTTLSRLWRKGIVDRRREGRAFAYRPVATRDEWVAIRMRELLTEAGDSAAALTHFVSGMGSRERGQLRRVVRRRS